MVAFSGSTFDPADIFAGKSNGISHARYIEGDVIFAQGDPSKSVFYIQHGRVKKSYISSQGKERVVVVFKAGEFFGVGCIVGRAKRLMSATAMTTCSVAQIEKPVMLRMLYEQPAFAEIFISFLIDRNSHYQEDLVDRLFHSSEKRLARALLLLSESSGCNEHESVVPKVSQETLAEIVGTTRSRINYFMNKFRQMGLLEYGERIRIRPSLLNNFVVEKFDFQDTPGSGAVFGRISGGA